MTLSRRKETPFGELKEIVKGTIDNVQLRSQETDAGIERLKADLVDKAKFHIIKAASAMAKIAPFDHYESPESQILLLVREHGSEAVMSAHSDKLTDTLLANEKKKFLAKAYIPETFETEEGTVYKNDVLIDLAELELVNISTNHVELTQLGMDLAKMIISPNGNLRT